MVATPPTWAGRAASELRFSWTVAEGDLDDDGVAVAANGLTLNGGAIQGSGNVDAMLAHPALTVSPAHKVDAVRPALLEGPAALAVSGRTVRLFFDETLDPQSVPASDAFTIFDSVTGDVTQRIADVSVRGAVVELSLGAPAPPGETPPSVTYTPPLQPAGALRDAVSNAVASFTATSDASAAASEGSNDNGQPASRGRPAAAVAEHRGSLAPRTVQRIGELLAAKERRTPAQRKLGSRLLDRAAAGDDGQVEVDIRADVTPALLARIRELGGRAINSHPRYRAMRASLPVSALERLAEADTVQAIREADEALTHARRDADATSKTNTSRGDVAHAAAAARSTHGVDGSGIVVGVISDGVDSLADSQATDDLPEKVHILPDQSGSGDEGTAMLEIVHDLAPGADLLFATGLGGEATFAANIEALCDAGAHVIVEDLYYPTERVFQGGMVAQAMKNATAKGCYVFSEAANSGNLNDGTSSGWEGDFAAGAAEVTYYDDNSGASFHDFGGGVEWNRITRRGAYYVLHWADALGASVNDYDLFLIDPDGEVLRGSTAVQDGTQDPFEAIRGYAYDPRNRLVVVKHSGDERYLRLEALSGGLEVVTAGNVKDHGAAGNLIVVGAVAAASAGGTDGTFDGTESVATYSADGPRRLFFELDGTAVTPGDFSSSGGKLVERPDIVAADCVATSPRGFDNYCGTSPAASHAAAIGALMLEAANGPENVTLAELLAGMANSALDIEADGVDRDSGAGIVMAPDAVADLLASERNGAPAVEESLADLSTTVDTTLTVSLGQAFSDPDDDALSFDMYAADARSGATTHVDYQVDGSSLMLTVSASSLLSVIVRATDPGGLTALQVFTVSVARGDEDYDADDDGLIEIDRLTRLDAVRYDPDGAGVVAVDDDAAYAMAFPSSRVDMGCPSGCNGYELTDDLDFDTSGDGVADAADTFWDDGKGWRPFPNYDGMFEGNGHVLHNLFIRRADEDDVGLFSEIFWDGVVRNLGLVDVDVVGNDVVGALAGRLYGRVTASYATGQVTGAIFVGGLIGSSPTFPSHTGASYAAVQVTGASHVGGLTGTNRGDLHAVYATGRVSGTENVGGLVGWNLVAGSVEASYARGRVTIADGGNGGGLNGASSERIGIIHNSYWDSDAGPGAGGTGRKTRAQLAAPTSYSGIYANWRVDVDDDLAKDVPWHFGTSSQTPALTWDLDSSGQATWQEFGYQLRESPTLTVATDTGQPVLTWTAVDASDWDPEPSVIYTVIRSADNVLEAVASGLDGLTYTDSSAIGGETYGYQVAAGVGAGEAVRSSIIEVMVPIPDTTPPAVKSVTSAATHPAKDAFTLTITFTKPVTGFLASEIEVDNGTGSNFTGSGMTYTLRVTPDTDFEGDVRITIPAGVAQDRATNPNDAGTATFAVDTRAPALVTTDTATVNGATLTLTFDEALAVGNTPASAFTATGGTTRSTSGVSVSGAEVRLTIAPPVLHGETGIEVDYTAPSSEALADAAGNSAASFEDQAVSNDTPATTLSTSIGLSLDTAVIPEDGGAKRVTVTGMLNRFARPSATLVTVEVGTSGDTTTEGADYLTVDDFTLTIPAYAVGATARFTLTPANDRIDEPGESLTVSGSTTASGLSVTPPGGLALDIEDNDAAPSLMLSVSASAIDEDGGTATVTVSTGSGSTFATDQTVQLSVAGTATETADYTLGGKTLTLPAGAGTNASMATATLTGVDDNLDDDDETIEITGSRNSVAFGSRQTIAIEDDDWPELTVAFRQADYRVAEGAHVDLPITLSAVPERQVTIPIDIEGAGGAQAIEYSVSPASLTFAASETDKTLRVSASNDGVADPGERVALGFGTSLPERISEGGIADTTIAIRDTDFTFAPAFTAGSGTTESDTDTYTVSETSSALRLSLRLETPRGAQVVDIVDPVVVTLATRENAGSRETDEDYATRRRSGTFGDYGQFDLDLSFAPGDFSDDGTCGCARADKAVSIDVFNDRVHERVEVFELRLSRKSVRLGVSGKDITVKIAEDDAEPALTLAANPGRIAEAGGASTVTVSTGDGSTFPAAQTIRLDLSGTATQGTDYTIDATSLTLPAGTGQGASSVTTTVRAKDDPIDDDSETVVLAASREAVEFARRTISIDDDETGSTRVDLAVNPAQVREDAGATTVRVTASLNADARGQDTEVAVTVGSSGDSAVEGTDYGTVGDLTLAIDAGETTAETTFSLDPTNNDSVEGAKTITVGGSAAGLAVRSTDLTLNDDDGASTKVTLTLDTLEVSESAGSRTVRVTGTLDGTARTTATVVAVTVGAGADTALEGTDYADVSELELTIPPNRTDGTVRFTLRPTNDQTAEGTETISVSGNVAGLTVVSAELALADDDSPSTRLDLSLNPSTVSEAAAPTDVVVTGSLNAGARTSDTVVTVTVGAPTDSATAGVDYANVSTLQITVPANEITGQTMFTLSPENDAIAEGAEAISVTGQVSGLTVEPATLTLSDNDTASRVVMLSVDPESVSENTPEDVTVTASLNAGARAGDTAVRLTVGAARDTAVPGTDYERVPERTLTILAGETSGTAAFRLEPVDNDSADGARTLSVTGSTTVAELRIEPATGASVALEDDDNPAVRVVPEELTVVEAASAVYTVALQTRPTADVTVMISGASGDLSLDKTSLVFTQADWRDPQTVEVTAADDDDSRQDPDVTLTHRASGAAEYRGLRTDLVVSIRENDPSLVFSGSALTVREGQAATYTVALATVPTADVTVQVTGVSGDLSLDETRLVFRPGDWDDAQTITVEAAEDDDTSTDPAVTLTHQASGGGYDGISGTVRVTITENDGGGTSGGGSGGGGGGGGGGSANRPPVVTDPIGAQVLELTGSVRIDAAEHFRDPDNRTMTFEAESADVSVATVEVDGSVVTVAGIAHGVTTVTLTAVDHRRLRVSQSFEVSVGYQLSFASAEVSAPEGNTAMLRVALNRPRDVATTVRYVLGVDADPATPDADAADHDGMGGEVTIATGATEADIGIAIGDDTDIEPPRESFTVTLQTTDAEMQDFGFGIATVRVTIDEGVCDRTRQVRNALRRSLPCPAVSGTDLAARTELDLANRDVAALQVDDLSGLSGLTVLDLSGNALTSLPDGMFAGLGALTEVQLQDNPGAPFTLQLELVRTDGTRSSPSPARVEVRVPEGAPFAMRAALSAVNGTLSPVTALVPAGMTAGTAVVVTQDAAGATRVTAAAPAIPDTRCGVLGIYPCYQGIATTAGGTLVLFKAPPEVTDTPSGTTLAAEGDAVRIDLSALFAASDEGALTYFAGSSDPTLATATVDGDTLTLASNEDGREGAVTITVTATDEDVLSVTLTFEVVVESIPRGLLRGWRRVLLEQAMERRAAEVE